MSRHLLNILTSRNNDGDNDDNNTDGENNNGTDNNVYNTNSNNYGGNNNSATPGCSASTAVPAIRRSLQSGMNYENNNNVFVQFSSMLPDAKREQLCESNISIPSSHDAVRKPIVVPIVLLQLQKPENHDTSNNPKNGTDRSVMRAETNKKNNGKFGDDDDDDDEQEQEQNFTSGANGHQGSVLLIPKMKENRNAMCRSENVINIHLVEASTENTNNSGSAKPNNKPESLFPKECGLIRFPHQSNAAHSILTEVVQNQQSSPTTPTTRFNNDGCCLPPFRPPRTPFLQPSAVSNQNNNNNNNEGNKATVGGEQANTLPLSIIEKSFFHAAFVAPVQPVAGSLLEENSTRVIRKILAKIEKINTRPLFTCCVEEASLYPKLRVKNEENKNENDDRSNEKAHNNNAKGNAGNDKKQKRKIGCGVTDSAMNQIFFGKDPRKWMKKNADMLFVTSESRVPNSFAHNGKDSANVEIVIEHRNEEQQQLLTSPRSQHREEQGKGESVPFGLSLGQRPNVSSSFPNNNCINPVSPRVFPSSPMRMATSNNANHNDSILSLKKAAMMKIPLHSDIKHSRTETREPSTRTAGNEESNQKSDVSTNNFTSSLPNFFRRFSLRCTLLNPLVHGRSNNSRRTSSVGANNNNTPSILPSQSQSRRKKRVSPKIVQVVNNNRNSIKSPSENNDDTSRQQQHQSIHKIYLPPQSQDRHQQITGVLSLPGMPLKVMTTTNDFVFRKRFKSIQQVQQYLLHANDNHNNNNGIATKTVVDILESEFASSGADGKTCSNALLPRASNVRDEALEKELSSIGVVPIVRSAEGDRLKVTRSTTRNSNSNSINMVPVTSEKRRIPVSDGHTICQNTSSYKCSTQMQHLFSHSNNNDNNNNNNNNGSKKCSESSNAPNNHKKSVCFVSAEPSTKNNHHNADNGDDVASDFGDTSDHSLSSSYIICDEEDDEILQLKKPSNATVLDVRDTNLREAVEVGSASYLTAFLESSPSAFDGAASSLGRYCGTFQPVVQLGKGAYGTAYLVVYKENEKLLQDHQKNSAAPEPVHTAEEFIANNNNNNQNRYSTENQMQRRQTSTLNNNGNTGFSLNNFSLVVSGALANNNNTYYANDTSAVRTNNIITDFAALVHRESHAEVQSNIFPSLVGSTSFHALTPRALANFQGCPALFNIHDNNNNTDDNSNNNNDDDTLIPRVSKRQFGFYNPSGAVAVKEIFTLSKSHNPGTNNNNEDNDNLTVNSTPSAAALRLSVSPPRPISVWNDNNNNNIFNAQYIPQTRATPPTNNSNNHKNLPSIFLSPAEQSSVVPRALRKKLLLPTAGPAGGVSGMSATTPVLILDIKNNKTGTVNPTTIRREDLFVCKVEQLPDPELVKRKKKMLAKQQRAPWDSDFDDEDEASAIAATTNKKGTRQELVPSSPKRMQLLGAVDNDKKQLLAMEANKKRLERMQNEAHILSNIAHPNIVAFVDYYLDKKTNQQLLFLEYVDGGDLQKEIERRSKFQPRRYFSIDSALHIFVQIVLAVEYLHRHNILHRDIKSQNILISKHCFVKLTDFGTSKQFDQDVDGLVDTKMVGTPLYLSPEIVAGKPYSQKSDIWALGVLLIEILSFGFPFDGANFPELRHNIQFRPPLPLRRPGPAVPHEILQLAGRLLQKDPDKRPTAKNILTEFACMRGAAVYYDKRVSQLVKSSLSTPVDAAWLTVLRDHFKLIYGHDANVTSQQSRARDSMLRGSIARERSHQNMSSVIPMKMSVVNLTSSQQMKNNKNNQNKLDAEEIAVERSAAFDSVKSYHYFHTVSPRRRQPGVPAEGGVSANAIGANASEMIRHRAAGEETF